MQLSPSPEVTAEATPGEEVTATPMQLPLITDYYGRVADFGFEGKLVPKSENERLATFEFARGNYNAVTITVSYPEDRVQAFMIALPFPRLPARAPDASTNDEERAIYAILAEAYYADLAWIDSAFKAFLLALDEGGDLAYPTVDAFVVHIEEAMRSEERREDSVAGFAFTVTMDNIAGYEQLKISIVSENG